MTENEMNDMLKSETKKLKEINAFIKRSPGGNLKIHIKNGQKYYSLSDGQHETYLSKKKPDLMYLIAQRNYYEKVKKIRENNIKELTRFSERYVPQAEQVVYAGLSGDRRELVKPYDPDTLKMIEGIESDKFDTAPYSEGCRYETDKGEKVRSKSEVIIANLLNGYCDVLRYQYEKPLYLENDGMEVMVHPDFTVYNLITGKIIYWELAGMIDDTEYASDFVRKYNLYLANGFIPCDNLMITFECQEKPLDIGNVKRIINKIAEG